jgi:hypothetical protein
MAKPNYQFEKRQRELAKKQKKAEKEQRKTHGHPSSSGDDGDHGQAGNQAADAPVDASAVNPAS